MIATFLFYDRTHGLQKLLSRSKYMKHCNVITYDGRGFIMTYLDNKGLHHKIIKIKSLDGFIDRLKEADKEITGIVSVDVDSRKKILWRPLIINSCNEVSRLISGVDIGFTLNPKSLYEKLHMFNGKRNFVIDYSWRSL